MNSLQRPSSISKCFRLLSDDIDEIAQRDVEIDQVKTPVRSEIANDIVGPGSRRIGMNCYFQVGRSFSRFTFRREQTRYADPGRFDWLFSLDPGFWLRCTDNRAAVRGEVGVEIAAASSERSRIGAGGDHIRDGDVAESRVCRWRNRRTERDVRNNAADLRCGTAKGNMLKRSPHIFATWYGQCRAEQDGGDHSGLDRLAIDFFPDEFVENKRTLRMRNENETAAFIIMFEVVIPRVPHVIVLKALCE